MNLYELTPTARRDLKTIWRYIARDSVFHANRLEGAILDNCELIASMPRAGHQRPDLTHREMLFWRALPFSNYLIAYDPSTKPVEILQIIQAAREKLPQ